MYRQQLFLLLEVLTEQWMICSLLRACKDNVDGWCFCTQNSWAQIILVSALVACCLLPSRLSQPFQNLTKTVTRQWPVEQQEQQQQQQLNNSRARTQLQPILNTHCAAQRN
jgi:hypothetical protein